MIHKSYQTKRNIEQDINLALDDALSEPEQAALRVHLAGAPDDAAVFNRMRAVDNLFSSAGMCQAPVDFASKVMAAIAAQPADQVTQARIRSSLGAAIGLLVAFVAMVPLAVVGVITLQHWLGNPAAINVLMQQVVMLLNALSQALASLFSMLATYTIDKPILPALLTTTIPLVMIWGWSMWYASMRRQQVVYRIPVRMA